MRDLIARRWVSRRSWSSSCRCQCQRSCICSQGISHASISSADGHTSMFSRLSLQGESSGLQPTLLLKSQYFTSTTRCSVLTIFLRKMTYAVAATVVCFGIGTVLQEFLPCRPFAKTWNPFLPGIGRSTPGPILAEAIINMLSDIAIISLPMPLVCGLQMTLRRKIILSATFGLGSMYVFALLVSS